MTTHRKKHKKRRIILTTNAYAHIHSACSTTCALRLWRTLHWLSEPPRKWKTETEMCGRRARCWEAIDANAGAIWNGAQCNDGALFSILFRRCCLAIFRKSLNFIYVEKQWGKDRRRASPKSSSACDVFAYIGCVFGVFGEQIQEIFVFLLCRRRLILR